MRVAVTNINYFEIKMPKLTEWFPAEIKPVRVGVYEVSNIFREKIGTYAYWDGKWWHGYNDTIDGAMENIEIRMNLAANNLRLLASQNKQWRGLAEQPKGK